VLGDLVMSEDIEKILNELMQFDIQALLASLNEPLIEVLLKDLYDSTERLLKTLRDG
jgi:hypothetical protein